MNFQSFLQRASCALGSRQGPTCAPKCGGSSHLVHIWKWLCTNTRSQLISVTEGLLSELTLFRSLGSDKYVSNMSSFFHLGLESYIILDLNL
jgi:hypothetical protein